jgi:basic membrane lipoprotein Med (substrate-binding protein (PBP1-ABC) superfamily)
MTVGRSDIWWVLAVQAGLLGSAIVGGSGEAAAQDQLKVAAVFETPIEEPWVNQIHVALLKAKDEYGIEYTWSESVSASDFARVLSGYAEQGHGLIMGDSFGTAGSPATTPRSPSRSARASGRRNPTSPCSTTGSTSRPTSRA